MIPKINLCRACLSSDSELFPSDDNFVCNYNMLTNINVKFSDGKPDNFCQDCMNAVNNFIEFRNKCISTEATLLAIINQVLKAEVVVETEHLNAVKVEVKHEDEDYDSENYFEDASSIVKTEECLEIKERKPQRHYKKNKEKATKVKVEKNTSVGNYNKLTSDKPTCGLCAKEFEDIASLNEHLLGHEVAKGCQLCSMDQFEDWPRLLAHRLHHIVYHQNCHLCSVKFRSPTNLEFHYRKEHCGEKNATLACNICARKFKNPRRLKKHIWSSHSSNQYICDICSKSYKNKQQLKMHIIAHGDLKPFACSLCEYSSKFHGGLTSHTIRKHTPMKRICGRCGAPFANAERLASHVCTDKSRVCPVCGKTLRHGYTRHVATHSKEANYKCDRCPAAYRTRGGLKVHKDKHDGNPTQQCEYCLRRFYSASVLIKHRRVHTGEKPYACKKCDMRFTGGYNLKVHMKVHGEMLVVKKNQEEAA